jgi:hypothetical protein
MRVRYALLIAPIRLATAPVAQAQEGAAAGAAERAVAPGVGPGDGWT